MDQVAVRVKVAEAEAVAVDPRITNLARAEADAVDPRATSLAAKEALLPEFRKFFLLTFPRFPSLLRVVSPQEAALLLQLGTVVPDAHTANLVANLDPQRPLATLRLDLSRGILS